MAKFVSPLLGYNNNVRHKNRVFHIQTEDSGINHPHIITHLFMDGGRILKSVKKSYAEHVGTEGMNEVVRQMMKEQHKAMFIALRDGQFDHLVDPTAAAPKTAKAAEPAAVEPAPPTDAEPVPAAAAPPPKKAASIRPAAAAPDAPPEPHLVVAEAPEEVPATTRQPEPPASDPARSLDLDAVETDAAGASRLETGDPPPPKNPFAKERGTGAAEPLNIAVTLAAEKSPKPGHVAGSHPPPPSRPAEGGRYAPARPAAIFGSSSKPPPSIFSDELVSDKSLDEVILSYLAEDLEPPQRK